MSLHIAAQNMASRGRGPDDTLVHMSRGEVKSLNDLAMAHGGHLTTNPDTGLPEAGFLKSILPMVIGAGLSVASGGTLTPMMAAMMTGGGYGLATGSLKKGLMAGLGAYGGAGLAGGLSAAGTAAAGAGEGLAGAAGEGLAGAAEGVQVGAPIVDSANMSQTGAASPDLFGGTARQIGEAYGYTPPPVTAAPVAAPTPTVPQVDMLAGMDRVAMENPAVSGFQAQNTGSMANAQRGLSGLMDNQASRDAFMNKMGGGTGLLKTGLMAAAPALMGGEQAKYDGGGPNPYEYSYDPRSGSYTRQAPGYRDAQTVTSPRMMAMGGLTAFAQGGQSHLGDYSDGGRMLRGPGDGVSDSIPATIGGKRPARLADGEFVVPARVVSELGNGSSEAGARKLYAMMDRVQGARKKSMGKNKVAVNSRADKMLPA